MREGGLETNKGRARCPGVVGRSKKVVMHWRRLNLNELNGELKSLGGFSACFSLSRVGLVPRNKNKTNHQPPTTNQLTPPTRSAPDKQDLFRPVFGGRQAIFFFPSFTIEPRRCRQAQNTTQPVVL